MCYLSAMNICFLKIFSKDITVEERLGELILNWDKKVVEMWNESSEWGYEWKEEKKRMSVYLPKC